jgi:2-polyprenyl-3-methyl-5-hydroxy-6-metoxy-1,4-benzoquinol methylase
MIARTEGPQESGTTGSFRYDLEIDVDSDSHQARIVRLVGTGKRVLELGCATGYMSRALRDRRCQVVAVEIDAKAAERAAAFCERVLVGDLDRLELARDLGEDRFDVVVAADVLEHLKDPLATLRAVRSVLKPDGYLLASIPNIAHGSVRLALLSGHFPYSETGLLDHTHLRFYSRETMEKLIEEAGFAIVHLERHEVPLADSEVPYDPAKVPAELLQALAQDPEALTYQFIVVAYPMAQAGLNWIRRHRLDMNRAQEAGRRAAADLQHQVQELAKEKEANQHLAADLQRQVHELSQEKEAAQRLAAELQQQLPVLSREKEAAQHLAADLQHQLQEQGSAVEAYRREIAERRQADEGREEQVRALTARVDLLLDREKELREMLLDAHDQLLRRDEEFKVAMATALQQKVHPVPTASPPEQKAVPSDFLRYQLLIHRLREFVQAGVPPGATVLVVSKGDNELLQLDQRMGWHFPQNEEGVYAGHHPADSAAAIAHLEALREKGADFLLFPSTALWWLDHYTEFRQHLESHYRVVARQDELGVLFALRQPPDKAERDGRQQYQQLVQHLREVVRTTLPRDASVIVVSKGDEDLLNLVGRQAWHFPQREDGVYAGHYPVDSAAAIAHLEALRAKGADYLLFPDPARWWLDHYTEFKQHLDSRYRCRRNDESCVLYELSGKETSELSTKETSRPASGRLRRLWQSFFGNGTQAR